ncbi:MAG TPA: type II toxin-antitoxin system PrlF family antitoxin [Gammaproteobacteria bacterium]|jgi:antitoxin PrlF|nr:type II toxin-antitoxin system PrlF family antitoxin [Gammaproteobacteria bacterium]
MRKILHTKSTLTDRYQTTIPESIREALHLRKRDKITYDIEESGKVIISRANEEDPVLTQFLFFLVNDIKKNPSHVQSINASLLKRAQSLVSDIEVDLDAPLSEKDE